MLAQVKSTGRWMFSTECQVIVASCCVCHLSFSPFARCHVSCSIMMLEKKSLLCARSSEAGIHPRGSGGGCRVVTTWGTAWAAAERAVARPHQATRELKAAELSHAAYIRGISGIKEPLPYHFMSWKVKKNEVKWMPLFNALWFRSAIKFLEGSRGILSLAIPKWDCIKASRP